MTSIDTLSPRHPLLPLLAALPLSAPVHSIIGNRGKPGPCGGWGVNFAGSASSFLAGTAHPSNKAFNARIKLACQRAWVPVIFSHALRHTAATLLLNERGANLRDVQALLGHKTPLATHTSIPSGSARSWETSGCTRSLYFFPMSQVRQKAERVGEIAAKAVVQLLFSTEKSSTVDGLREKLREFFREEVRSEVRAVAALNNVELITALLVATGSWPLSAADYQWGGVASHYRGPQQGTRRILGRASTANGSL